MRSAGRHSGDTGATRGSGPRRLPVVMVVVLALVGAGLVARALPSAPPRPPASSSLATVAAPAGAESSSWFCTGDTGTAGGEASATLYLVNAGRHAVTGTVTVANSAGAVASAPVTVPAGTEITVVPGTIEQGQWLASHVDLYGGAVTVSEMVDGALGWAVAPCATSAAPDWYFPAGATLQGDTMDVALFNPGVTTAVVDLTFVTPRGESEPTPFEGLVLAPGAVKVADVSSYVQDQPSVSTIVQARSGRVVAEVLEGRSAAGASGLSLRLGAPGPASSWAIARSVNVTGSRVTLVVFNPAAVAQHVTVRIQLPSGPVAPFEDEVPPDATWDLVTSAATRIPGNVDYGTTVTSTGGPGVVVDRVAQSPGTGAAPQWGTVSAISGGAAGIASGRWVLPSPALPGSPPEPGAAPLALALQNIGRRAVTVTVRAVTPSGARRFLTVRALRIPPAAFAVVESSELAAAGSHPVSVGSTGPIAVMEDGTPAGMPGVVAWAGIPLGD